MSDANLKNDVTIKGAGLEYTLRPSFQCLMNIESKAKKSILQLIQEFNEGKGSLADTITILKEGTRASGTIITDKQVEALIEQEGVMTVQMQLVGFWVKSMYGGKTQEALNKKKVMEESTDPLESSGTTITE